MGNFCKQDELHCFSRQHFQEVRLRGILVVIGVCKLCWFGGFDRVREGAVYVASSVGFRHRCIVKKQIGCICWCYIACYINFEISFLCVNTMS